MLQEVQRLLSDMQSMGYDRRVLISKLRAALWNKPDAILGSGPVGIGKGDKVADLLCTVSTSTLLSLRPSLVLPRGKERGQPLKPSEALAAAQSSSSWVAAAVDSELLPSAGL
eukprot:jgi/Chlat1/4082/Chrsp26S04140